MVRLTLFRPVIVSRLKVKGFLLYACEAANDGCWRRPRMNHVEQKKYFEQKFMPDPDNFTFHTA